MIRQQPWFSAAIVGTLALGIGVNTTVFTLVNGVMFKPLPFAGGERLVMVEAKKAGEERGPRSVSYADWRDYKAAATSFERLEAFQGMNLTVSEQGNPPERLRGGRVTSGLFAMLRMQPVLGRALNAEDEKPGAEAVLMLGYGVWKDRYGLNPNVIGRTVRAAGKPAVIVGVMPEGFKFPSNEDIWMAAVPDEEMEKRSSRNFQMMGILRQDATMAGASADLSVVAKRLQQQYPATHKDYGIVVKTFHESMNGGPIRLVFLLMMGAVGFVLLIACANVANMLLGRAIGREREIAIRLAMGATSGRIIRQLLVESILLSVVGGLLGLGLASVGVGAFAKAVENVGKPYWVVFSMDYVVFSYFAVVSILAGILFGLAPAVQAASADVNGSLKEGSKSAGGVRTSYFSGALVVLQFALAVVLLSGAGLMIQSFVAAQNEFAGIQGVRILHARVSLPDSRYANAEARRQFFDKLMPRLAALPGVEAVGMTSSAPGDGGGGQRFEIAGQPMPEPERRPAANVLTASPGYFGLLGLGVTQGRDFEATDGQAGKETALVSRLFVAKHFPQTNPLGQKLRFFGSDQKPEAWLTIVGVVPDVRQPSPESSTQDPVVIVPHRMDGNGSMALLVKTSGNPAGLSTAVRREVQQLDELLPLFSVEPLAETMARSRWHLRVFGVVFGIFAFIALGLAAVGIYAVISHATGRRTREIGIRLALGATGGMILRDVLQRGLLQLGLGLAVGVTGAWLTCRLMGNLLFQVSADDPTTYLGVAGVLLLAGVAACVAPALKAARLDPLAALRQE